MIIRMMVTRTFMLQILAWLLISVAVLGFASSCVVDDGGRGMHQGGSDSEPHWH